MSKLRFVRREDISKSYILAHFKKVNITLEEWEKMFNLEDLKLNIEGKITRREYFARLKRNGRVPYKYALLFNTPEDLLKAFLVIGTEKIDALNKKQHEEMHANKIRNWETNPAFGIFIQFVDSENVKYKPFTFQTDFYEVMYRKKLSIEDEIKQMMDVADIEDKSPGDYETIKEGERLLEKYKKIKEEKGTLPKWKW